MEPRSANSRPTLTGFATFLQQRGLAPAKRQPHMVRWVGCYLSFAKAHLGYTFDQTADLFLAWLEKRPSIQP